MNAIEIRGLTKTYKDFTLDNLNLTLPSGCIMGLIGENGAGKSTTIKLLLDIIHRDSGTINVLGQDSDKGLEYTKEDIGVVLDEVGFPDCFNTKLINKVMKNIYRNWDEELYLSYLDKLSIPSGKEFKDYSRGMKMKLGIAAALSHNP